LPRHAGPGRLPGAVPIRGRLSVGLPYTGNHGRGFRGLPGGPARPRALKPPVAAKGHRAANIVRARREVYLNYMRDDFFRFLAASAMSAFLLASCSGNGGPAGPEEPGETDDPPAALVSGYREYIIDRERLQKPWGKALGDIDGDGF